MLQNQFAYLWESKLTDFYKFIEASRNFLKKDLSQTNRNLIRRVRKSVEISHESPTGTVYKRSKFDSAIYYDIDRIALWREFFQRFALHDLKYFQKLIYLEIQGLGGDLQPKNIIAASLPTAIITWSGIVAAWSAFWATIYFDFDITEIFVGVFRDKISHIPWINEIVPLIFVFGGFVGISSYVAASYRNLNRIFYLKSLYRAIAIYLLITGVDK